MKYQFILALLSIFLFASTAFARVVINEFVIDSTPQQIELFNTGSDSADISNWYLDDSGGTSFFTIPQTILPSHGCIVFQSDFNLNKSTPDQVRLFDNSAPPASISAMLMDSFSYKASSGSAISYFRFPDGDNIWATGSATFGFLNSTNERCFLSLPIEVIPTSSPTPTTTLTPTPVFSDISHIFISEVMIYPDKGNNEWIELYNDNNFSVDLVDWYIDDLENAGSSPKKFTVHIESKNYAVIELSSSIFNNDTDSLRLLNPQKTELESLEYFSPKATKSMGRTTFESDVLCNQDPSKNMKNNSCLLEISPTPRETPIPIKVVMTTSPRQSNDSFSVQSNPQYTQGTILGESHETIDLTPHPVDPLYLDYAQGLSTSAIIISIMNIILILGKVVRKQAQKSV